MKRRLPLAQSLIIFSSLFVPSAVYAAASSASFPVGMSEDLNQIFSGLSVQCGAPEYPRDSPSAVKVIRSPAFPILSEATGENSHLGAAARMGKGRMAVIAHHAYRDAILKTQPFGQGCSQRFMDNLLTWLTQENPQGFNATHSTGKKMNVLVNKNLSNLSFHPSWLLNVVVVDKLSATVLNPVVHPLVYVNEEIDASERAALETYLKNGGGVIWTSRFWSLISYPSKSIQAAVAPAKVQFSDYPIVQLMQKAGIEPLYLGNGKALPLLTPDQIKIQHPVVAMEYWKQVQRGERTLSSVPGLSGGSEADRLKKLEKTIEPLFSSFPVSPAVADIVENMKAVLSRAWREPSKKFICQSAPFECKVAALYYKNMTLAPNQPMDSSAPLFPGRVSAEAQRLQNVLISLDNRRVGHGYRNEAHPGFGFSWESTGLYAPPGETLDIQVQSNVADPGLLLRIGSHTDVLDNNRDLTRPPKIAFTQPLKMGLNRVSSPFGGLIYLEPRQFGAISTQIRISGAVKAPYFRRGMDSDAAWSAQLKQPTAPWGELEGQRMILTVPTSELMTLTQPNRVMEKWDRFVEKYDQLMGLSPQETAIHRPIAWPWRMVPDIQISGGYMHSGYPIMTHLDVPKTWVDERSTQPFLGSWGEWHELGHNTQLGLVTWSGNTEVTCNIHSLNIESANKGLDNRNWDRDYEKTAQFMAEPNHSFLNLKDIGPKLVFFHQFTLAYQKQQFWPKVYRAFREMASGQPVDPRLKGLPFKTDSDKINSFAIVSSLVTGENLLSQFDVWGFPQITQATRDTIEGFNFPQPRVPLWKLRSDCVAAKKRNPAVQCIIPS